MKNILLFISFLTIFSCSDFDDTAINKKINELEIRLAELEEVCTSINSNITSLQTIVNVVQNQDCITGLEVVYADDGTTEIGYTINFKQAPAITIYHGETGKDGIDGHTPIIGVKKADDGISYWTLDDEWIIDSNGEKVCAIGIQGEAGIAPQFKIERNPLMNNIPYWYISYDNRATWTALYQATGENGTNGKDGDSLFESVELSENGVKLIITMNDSDKTVYEIPVSNGVISSLTFIPRYADGKIGVEYRMENGGFYLIADFKVLPANLAEVIATEWASATTEGEKNVQADYTEVLTRTLGQLTPLPVSTVTYNNENPSVVTVEMQVSSLELLNKSFFVSVAARVDGGTLKSSAYIPVYAEDLEKQLAYVPDFRPAPISKGDLLYVWGDEFNIDGPVDDKIWEFEKGFKRGNEPQVYVEGINNAIVKDGRLLITAKKEKTYNANYVPGTTSTDYRKNQEFGDYSSASIRTRQKRFFLFGHVEVRAKIDNKKGAFPAIWTCGNNRNWPLNGEIDIMEFYDLYKGEPQLTSNFATGKLQAWEANWWSKFTPLSYYETKDPDWINKYHVYSMDWDEEEITLFVDGEYKNKIKIAEATNSDGSIAFDNPQYMWLNLALKNRGQGIALDDNIPITFEVDYFRVYQKVIDNENPTQVQNLKASTPIGNSVYLTWDASEDVGSGIRRYDIYKNAIGDGNFIASTENTTYMVMNAKPNEAVTYYVQALDNVGNYSLPSNIVARAKEDTEELAVAQSGESYSIVNAITGKTFTHTPKEGDDRYDYITQTNNNEQKWTLLQDSKGWAIKDASADWAIQVQLMSKDDGAKMIYWNHTSTPDWHQRFIFEKQVNGLYMIKNVGNGKYLGVSDEEDGTLVVQWSKGTSGQYQYWKLIK